MGGNTWYQGKHEPIVSKDLFDLVQDRITSQTSRVNNQEFAFTKLMKCGLCGSGITADEKIKKQLNGNIHRYVYYGCTRFNDKECKCGYIREDDLIKQLENLIDQMSLDEIGIKQKIKAEVERHKKFQAGMLGIKSIIKVADIDIRNYAKYILRDGTNLEKRELISCFKSKVVIKNKLVSLE
ncbi:MAG: zinc ribbon domain-containing protein [Candidatus Portnoybacteria bacterium]|nr:zinc ribbon domain-containing protein [Candidatus Portnoybacteria bacterium]MDD4982386.1 zinc ribbon domain-containing protein [Candidatus Portnoybacteria bacterium]